MNAFQIYQLETIRDEQKYLVEVLKVSAKYFPEVVMKMEVVIAEENLRRIEDLIRSQIGEVGA